VQLFREAEQVIVVRLGEGTASRRTKERPEARIKVTEGKERIIRQMKAKGEPIAEIARTVEVSRQTVYEVLAR